MPTIEKELNEAVPIKRNYPLDEAAPLIGVTLGTLRQWVSAGKIKSLKIGRKRVIPSRVLEEIIEKGL
jgi:excisionase family DNA binding protein